MEILREDGCYYKLRTRPHVYSETASFTTYKKAIVFWGGVVRFEASIRVIIIPLRIVL